MDGKMTRRTAMALLVGVLGTLWAALAAALSSTFLLSTVRFGTKDEETLLGDLSIYSSNFRAIRLRVPVRDGWYKQVEQKLLYIKEDKDNPASPIVLSATCTHLGCTVKWDEEAGAEGEFVCPCHGGRFGPDGQVLAGPPPSSLRRIAAEIHGGDVYARNV